MNVYRGIVIDHVPYWKGSGLLETLGLQGSRAGLLLGQTSARMGKKDILIVAEYDLGELEEQRLALYAPELTLNFIDKGKVVRKKRPRLPKVLHQIIACLNPRCITRAEEVPHKILNAGHRDSSLQCHYCQHTFAREEVQFL